jgi:hypothetical protein
MLTVYCLSAVVVLIGLSKAHYNKHLTWMEAMQVQTPDRGWLIVAAFVFTPVENTILAACFILCWPALDRVNDD